MKIYVSTSADLRLKQLQRKIKSLNIQAKNIAKQIKAARASKKHATTDVDKLRYVDIITRLTKSMVAKKRAAADLRATKFKIIAED